MSKEFLQTCRSRSASENAGSNSHEGQSSNASQEREVYRLSTYLKFPAIAPVDVIDLARHGYYYTGHKDRVKCFSCGAFIQDWCPQYNPRLARWHLQGCKLVLGTETSNVPIGIHKPKFVGTFTSSTPTSGTGYSSSAASSSENPLHLFPSYPTRSFFLSMQHSVDQQRMIPPEISLATASRSPDMSNLTCGDDIEVGRNNSSTNDGSLVSTPLEQPQPFEDNNRLNENRVKVLGLDLASVVSSSHRRLLVQQLDLHKEEDRRKSFANWNCDAVDAESLAKSGFFYLGSLNRCQCFSCSGVLQNWRNGDCVEDEHRRHFGDCKMVLGRENRNIPSDRNIDLTEPADPSPEERLLLEREFPCLYPVNPHMRDYEARLQTFDQRWPSHKVLATKEHIAKAGFFFLGDSNIAKCWYCNGGLHNWDLIDEPFTEHAKWFPGCEYILRCKGRNFVRNITQQFPNLQRPTLRRPQQSNSPLVLSGSPPTTPTQHSVRNPRDSAEADPPSRSLNIFQRHTNAEMEKLALEDGYTRKQFQDAKQVCMLSGKTFSNPQEFICFLSWFTKTNYKTEDSETAVNSPAGTTADVPRNNASKRRRNAAVEKQRVAAQETGENSSPKMSRTDAVEDRAHEH